MNRILYLGSTHPDSTSHHRANALVRLGYTLEMHNSWDSVTGQSGFRYLSPVHFRTGYRFVQYQVRRWLKQLLPTLQKPDLIWVDSGELFGPSCLAELRQVDCPMVLYNVDDPTGPRDGNRFASLRRALPLYDQVVVVRRETEQECLRLGAQRVLRVLRSYDEVAHFPFSSNAELPDIFHSEVAFIGTWMRHEKRDEFLLHLINQGVPISIWGGRWDKSPHWSILKNYYRGGALGGREYVAAVQGAKICLGLLSKGNRDLHTQRSLEVPFAGGLLCAERTSEHQELYREGTEAVFWSDAAECAQVCHELLSDEARRERIRLAGMRRVRALNVGNEDICRKILGEIAVFQEA